jgi:hypothetical protein
LQLFLNVSFYQFQLTFVQLLDESEDGAEKVFVSVGAYLGLIAS